VPIAQPIERLQLPTAAPDPYTAHTAAVAAVQFNKVYPTPCTAVPSLQLGILMTAPYDLWIQRVPRVSKAEWHSLVAAHSELRQPNPEFSELPLHAHHSETLSEFVWWFGASDRLPTKVTFINGAIHIEAADPEARALGQQLAAWLGASVQEG
jgi:hypothetical protein